MNYNKERLSYYLLFIFEPSLNSYANQKSCCRKCLLYSNNHVRNYFQANFRFKWGEFNAGAGND